MYKTLERNTSLLILIKTKATRLLIPYVFFGLLWMIPIKCLLQIPSYQGISLLRIIGLFLIGHNNGHLQFLLTLFWMFVLLFPVNVILMKCKYHHIYFIILNLSLCCYLPFRQIVRHNYFNLVDVL